METDSIPRIKIRDMMLAVQAMGRGQASTLEELRLKLNLDRGEAGRLTNYSVARDVAAELARQGYAEVGALPKDMKAYEKKMGMKIALTDRGRDLANLLRSDRAAAYAAVLRTFYGAHPYFRRFVTATADCAFLTPVITSAEEHISFHYTSARLLAEDIARGAFDVDALLASLTDRLGRPLTPAEQDEITAGVGDFVQQSRAAAASEPFTDFSRKALSRLNEVVVPAVLRAHGLGFDFNTLRRLWKMGEEFQICWATSAHPRFKAWVTFETATVDLSPDGQTIAGLRFENGLAALRGSFLDRVYATYLGMREWGRSSVVLAWELRAAFCFEHRCAPGVFNRLFEEHYNGSDVYEIGKDFPPRNKPQHEEPLVLGGRQIGLIRMTKR
ncbi:hypothetical protein D3869_16920 (plasmid) [Azospirillum brasilense]|uniref:Uncharacterized protein n=1 Tax=Azospirillum brasilense TaxID=192 RepID=A0A4D8R5X6_AZOBR|nr:hypothetical protein [Azospirillum brasilense]QCO16974.1 hypothetical protein D3869_16920 [Azospirillum brasilense]